MKASTLLLAMASMIIATSSQASENENDVLKALLKLESRVETGVNLADYNAARADVALAFKMLTPKELRTASVGELKIADDLYSEAASFWHISNLLNADVGLRIRTGDSICSNFSVRHPGKIPPEYTGSDCLVVPDKALQALWGDAAAHVEKARSLK